MMADDKNQNLPQNYEKINPAVQHKRRPELALPAGASVETGSSPQAQQVRAFAAVHNATPSLLRLIGR
jgi:hypothetical protein